MEYRQSPWAILFNNWKMMLLTVGYGAIYNFFNYKNTKLVFSDKFLTYETGVFTKTAKEISYEDILSIRADQSLVGQFLHYAIVRAVMKNNEDTIEFKFAASPEAVRKAIQQKFVASQKHKIN